MDLKGTTLAAKIFDEIHKEIKIHSLNPKLVIITLGDESSWKAYVRQKLIKGKDAGIETIHLDLKDSNQDELIKKVNEFNRDKTVNGLIVQRPLPEGMDREFVANYINPLKDVDGFQKNSPYEVPVWLAVEKFLEEVFSHQDENQDFLNWLKTKKITVIGKGASAGELIIKGFKKLGVSVKVIDSKTPSPEVVLKNSDIIVSCVGKRVISSQNLKKGVVLIGVGIHVEDGKVKGDYDEQEVKQVASYYTPTPGGVGPLNLAFLFKNVVSATNNQS